MITELDAVNYGLSILGSSPIGNLDDRHPDADICLTRVRDAAKQVQKDGFWFNRELCWTLTPDETTNEIILPSNTLKVIGIQGDFVIQRGMKLYDTQNNTYQFTAPIVVDIIVELVWDELPFSVQDWAKHLASQKLCEIDLEDNVKAGTEEKHVMKAEVTVKKEEHEITRRNALLTPKSLITRAGVRPYNIGSGVNPNRPGG